MNGRVLDFAMHTHHEAQRLLPWLANGTLEPGESGWLHGHLDHCAECRRGLQDLQALHAAILESGLSPADAAADADAGWRRVRSRIASPHGDAHATGRGTRASRRMPRALAWALAAQALLVAALGIAWWASRAPPPGYHTLGSAPQPAGDLLVVFDPRISEAQLRRLLDASDARIVDGPTDAGAYVLSVPDGRAERVRDALRAAPGVTMVESLAEDRSR
jgi:hypothetical protein